MSSIGNNNVGGLPPGELPKAADGTAQPGPGKAAKAASKAAVGGEALQADPTFASNQGVIGEKRRTGFAALASPPPLPPNAPALNAEAFQQFAQLQNEYHDGLLKGAPGNQPSILGLGAKLNAIDTSTPEGRAQATKVNAQLTHTTLNALATTTSGDTLGAFLLATMKQQTGQRNAEDTLLSLTSSGQKTMLEQQRAQHAEQAKEMKKAADKQAKFAFLKPLLAIFTVLLTVLTAGSVAMLGLALIGSMAGFLAGGIISGKKNGTGFSFTGALEGASMGAMAGGIGAILKAALVGIGSKIAPKVVEAESKRLTEMSEKLSKTALATSSKSMTTMVTDTVRSATKQAADTARREANAAARKVFGSKVKEADAAAEKAAADEAGHGHAASDAASSGKGKAGTAGKAGEKAAAGKPEGTPEEIEKLKAGKRDRLMSIINTDGSFVGDSAQNVLDFSVSQHTAKGAKFEAEAKLTQTFLDQYKMLYEHAMDSAQGLIQARKASSEMDIDMLRAHYEANKNIIGGFGRG